MMGLTPMQERLLAFLESHLRASKISPSFSQMADGVGLKSNSGISRLVTALEERGYIRRLPGRMRSIVLIPQQSSVPTNEAAITVVPLPEVRREIEQYAAEHGISVKTAAEQALREWFMEPAS